MMMPITTFFWSYEDIRAAINILKADGPAEPEYDRALDSVLSTMRAGSTRTFGRDDLVNLCRALALARAKAIGKPADYYIAALYLLLLVLGAVDNLGPGLLLQGLRCEPAVFGLLEG
ncbi:MAG: hypothetical protein WC869_10435 [Phycisphaerae bacterium]|jgi:hypothetical protein